jgi:tetratricopeptide (TPR) repeat protein
LERNWSAGRFDRALGQAEALLALRQKAQGNTHWQAADARWQAEAVRRVLAQDAATRTEMAHLPGLIRQADEQRARANYAASGATWEKVHALRRKVLGEDHPDTAFALSEAAYDLVTQGRYADARPLFEKALAVLRKALGEDHPDTARAYNNLGHALHMQGQLPPAQRLLEKSLAVRRAVLGQQDPDTAAAYNNLAVTLRARGQYAAAQPMFEKALAVRRKVLGDEHPATAQSYNNLAANLNSQGNYAAAQPLHEKALAVCRKALGEEHPETARAYHNLAADLQDQGRHAAAQPFYEKALAVRRKVFGDAHPVTALSYDGLALNLSAQGRYADAQPLHEKALDIRRRRLGDDHPETAESYSGLAANLHAQEKYAAARPLYEKALDVRRRLLGEAHPHTAQAHNNLAANLSVQGEYAAARAHYAKALAVCRRSLGETHPITAGVYNSLAHNFLYDGKYAEAEVYATRAAEALARARLRVAASGLERIAATSARSSLPLLAALQARAGRAGEAWQRYQQSLARGTWDDLSARLRRSPADRDRQLALVEELRRLDHLIERTFVGQETPEARQRRDDLLNQRRLKQDELEAFDRRLEQQYGPVTGQVYDQAHIQGMLLADAALVGWIDGWGEMEAANRHGEHWAVVLRACGAPAWVRLRGSGPDGAWTEADARLASDLRRALQDPAGDWRTTADRLSQQRLGPLAGLLAAGDGLPAVRRLIVLPSPAVAGVPLDVCAKGYAVSYAPSGTIFAYLRGLARPDSRGVLALADPVFARRPTKARPSSLPPAGLLAQNRAGADEDWPELPGTRAEAGGLAILCRRAGVPFRLLADSDASEEEVDRLARSKELARYRYIHLATHGDLNDRLPLQSAVILARDHLPDPVGQLESGRPAYDGRLTAERMMERWDLHAELVTLSACDTALGKYEAGEGFVGFTQALLLSGARSVCLSLWKVDDTATALLMQRFYANLLGQRTGLKKPLGKAEALAEAKRWLRDLTAEEAARQAATLRQGVSRGQGRKPLPPATRPPIAKSNRPYAHPFYWAAFVLAGEGD